MLLSSLGTSIANVALPALSVYFHASFQEIQWVVLAYLLTITSLIVGAGRLGDLFGRRRLLLAGTALFTLAATLAGAASSLGLLIAARALQGLGAAFMMSLTLALVAGNFPKEKTGSAMGLLGTMSAVGTALGPSLGGLLLSVWSFRAVFLIQAPLGLGAIWIGWLYLPQDEAARDPAGGSFDALGTLLLTLSLASYAGAMTLGRGHFGWLNAVLLLGAGTFGLFFLRAQQRARSPLIALAMLRDVALRSGLLMSLLVSTVIMATLVVGPFYLSRSLGLGAALVGIVMSTGPLVSALTGVPAGRLVDGIGATAVTRIGLGLMSAGTLLLSLSPTALGAAFYVAPLVVTTAGYALFQAANNTSLMAEVAPDRRGVASGMLNLSRNLGLITGTSMLGAVFASAAGTSDLARAAPEAVGHGMGITFGVAAILILCALKLASQSRGPAIRRVLGARTTQ